MNFILFKLIILIISFTINDLNKIIYFGIFTITSKILLDNRSLYTQFKNNLLQKKLNNLLKKNKNILIIVYKYNIILVGEINNIKNLIKIKNIINKNINYKYKILNKLICVNNKNKYFNNIEEYIRMYLYILFKKNKKIFNSKIIIKKNIILIINFNKNNVEFKFYNKFYK